MMTKLAANLTMLFNEVPFLERFKQAKLAGFQAVEFLFPYEYEPEVLAQSVQELDMSVALFNLPPGDWDAGEKGIAALPGREQEFRDSVDTALLYAQALDCRKVHAMSGLIDTNYSLQAHLDTFIDNLRYAADTLGPHGIEVMIEPLNHYDAPNYFIAHQRQAVEYIQKVQRSNVKLQLDLYHAQIMDGDLVRLINEVSPWIGHVQIASVPDRHEPFDGELNYPYLFNALQQAQYLDWIGCEYKPKNSTHDGLGWAKPYL